MIRRFLCSSASNRIDAGVPKADAYAGTMTVMAGLLVVGFVANLVAARRLRAATPVTG